MRWSGRIAVASLLAAVVLVFLPGLTLPLDAAVHRLVQGVRTCGLVDTLFMIDVVVRVVFGAMVAGVLARERGRAVPVLAVLVAIAIAGGAMGELLKTAFERMRPNEAPGDLSGNSFPSGHVMNTTLAAVAAAMWVSKLGWQRGLVFLTTTVGAACVLAEIAYRLLNGSHWTSDAVGSVLLGIAWMLGVEELRPKTSWRSLAAASAAFVTAYATFYEIPDLRIRLRSVLDREGAAVAAIELGAPSPALLGEWSHGWREPVGGVSWVIGREVAIELPATAAGSLLRLTLRPPSGYEGASGCVRVRVGLDDREETLTLLEGWREYHFEVASRVVTDGRLQVVLFVLDDVRVPGGAAPGVLAVHDVRLE